MTQEAFKILAICLLGAALCVVLKSKSGEFAFVVALGVGVFALIFVFGTVAQPIKEITQKLNDSGINMDYFKIALKTVGIAYITDFIADACSDAGQISIANKAELVGKGAIFILTLPLLLTVLETAIGFMK